MPASSRSSTSPPRGTTPIVLVSSADVDSPAVGDTFHGGTRTPPANTTTLPATTPLSKKIAGTLPYSSTATYQDHEFRTRLAAETAGHFLGPVPCQTFLDRFLPLRPGAKKPSDIRGKFSAVMFAKREAGMYKPFIQAARTIGDKLVFVDTSGQGDPNCGGLKPDISVYLKSPESESMRDRPTDFSKMEFWAEFKFDADHDAFRDDAAPPVIADYRSKFLPFEHDSQHSINTRGQIASYASAQMGTQFRTHIFSLLICNSSARLIRWDRSCAIVSESFDYVMNGHHLVDFLWRYNSLEYRGRDSSVSSASLEEAKLAETLLGWEADAHLKLMVPRGSDSNNPRCGYYLVQPPKYASRSPFGRATRHFFACDIENKKRVFLKDYWRVDEPGMEKEGDIYVELKKHNVRHIASFDCGDDVNDHQTLAHTLKQEDWGPKKITISPYKHYRMVLGTVFRDLLSFNSSWEYVKAIADAAEAHHDAYFRAGILHRDISVGNILLTENGGGVLIDWDQSVRVPPASPLARRPGRTGTWQFLSAKLLLDPDHVSGFEDDRESIFWVLLWISLRYTAHSQDNSLEVMQFFDEEDSNKAGPLKASAFLAGAGIPYQDIFKDRPLLNDLLRELANVFAVRYEPLLSEGEIQGFDGLNKETPEVVLRQCKVYQYRKRLGLLGDPEWLADIINFHLKDRSQWPANDQQVRDPTQWLAKLIKLQDHTQRPAVDTLAIQHLNGNKRRLQLAWVSQPDDRVSKMPRTA